MVVDGEHRDRAALGHAVDLDETDIGQCALERSESVGVDRRGAVRQHLQRVQVERALVEELVDHRRDEQRVRRAERAEPAPALGAERWREHERPPAREHDEHVAHARHVMERRHGAVHGVSADARHRDAALHARGETPLRDRHRLRHATRP